MKTALLFTLLLTATIAHAETIALDQVGCGLIGLCNDVPNDGGFIIDLSYSSTYGQTTLYMDGKAYYSKPKSPQPWAAPGIVLTAADGTTALLTGSFTTTRVYVSNGRAHYWATRWYFEGGGVVR